jgi:hypothetical protein
MADYMINFVKNTGDFYIKHDFQAVAVNYRDYDDETCTVVFSEQQFAAIVEAWQKVKDTNSMTAIKAEVKT